MSKVTMAIMISDPLFQKLAKSLKIFFSRTVNATGELKTVL
jgi:hypothetical protein